MAEQLSNNKFGWLIIRDGHSPKLFASVATRGPGALACRGECSIVQSRAGRGGAGGSARHDPVRRRRMGGDRSRRRAARPRRARLARRRRAGRRASRRFAFTPDRRRWGEFSARLSRQPRAGSSVMLRIDKQRFLLVTRGNSAWSRGGFAGTGADRGRSRDRRYAYRGPRRSGAALRRSLCACRSGNRDRRGRRSLRPKLIELAKSPGND